MYAIKDQVVWKRGLGPGSHARTREVRVGEISAFADQETAVVSFALLGGRMERKEIKLSELEPVSKVYRRAQVQLNPVHRQIVSY